MLTGRAMKDKQPSSIHHRTAYEGDASRRGQRTTNDQVTRGERVKTRARRQGQKATEWREESKATSDGAARARHD